MVSGESQVEKIERVSAAPHRKIDHLLFPRKCLEKKKLCNMSSSENRTWHKLWKRLYSRSFALFIAFFRLLAHIDTSARVFCPALSSIVFCIAVMNAFWDFLADCMISALKPACRQNIVRSSTRTRESDSTSGCC